nr:MAG TPA_asm: hypothetical protein [Caudoviricetes sp.]
MIILYPSKCPINRTFNRPGHCATRGRGLPPEVRPLPVALSAYPFPRVP